MPLLKAFAIRDQKADAFMRPFFMPTRGMAIRTFSDMVNDASHELYKHTEDYFLFELGSFDEDSGVFVSTLVSLGNALEFRNDSGKLKVAK